MNTMALLQEEKKAISKGFEAFRPHSPYREKRLPLSFEERS